MTATVLLGDVRTGRITNTVPVTGGSWKRVLDDSGDVSGVTCPEEVVRGLQLRNAAAVGKSFLAIEDGDRILQAGPVWTHGWSWESQTLTLGAGGLWSLFDHRKVLPVLALGQRAQDADTVITGTDLGGVARQLVAQALTHVGGNLPLVLPPLLTGSRQETFRGYSLLWVGDQLRQLTKRETWATNIRFTPRRRADDRRFLEWVMEVGTEAAPQLTQLGSPWVLDASRPTTPVVGISGGQDGTALGFRSWVTGNGTETKMLIASRDNPELVTGAGYPLLEVDEGRNTVDVQATLDAYADNLAGRRARPTETIKVTVRADAAAAWEVGDRVQLIAKNDAYYGDYDQVLRIIEISGAVLSDDLVLAMAPTSVGV